MYIPPYSILLSALAISGSQMEAAETVSISAQALKFLIRALLSTEPFDEVRYLAENVDVSEAVQRGELKSGLQHFIQFGYFEGRPGGPFEVDEKWYVQHYPDIAAGLQAGAISSASQHFHLAGAVEGRSPRDAFITDAEKWKFLFQRLAVHRPSDGTQR